MASAIKKANVIKQIVRLSHFVNRWKSRSIPSGSDEPGGSNRRIPSGSVAVYVGSERRRFVISTRFLNFPVFVDLLDQAEEEFGYQHSGGLSLPCEADFFGEIVCLLEEDEEKCRDLRMEEFAMIVAEMRFHSNDCRESSSAAAASRLAVTPLLQKTRV